MSLPASPGLHAGCHRINSLLSIIGDKWTVMIVMVLGQRPHRFNDLKRAVGGISQQMLTRTLRQLERDGMVARKVHPTVPPQVEYALTALGHSLASPVQGLSGWAQAHIEEIERNREGFDDRDLVRDVSSR